MKTNYLLLLFLMLTTVVVAQNNDFNNGGADFIWSNPDNWSLNAVPVPANTVRLPVLAESQVDANYTITKIQTIFATSNANPGSTVPVAGSSTLTINAGTANAEGIFNPSNHNAKLTFRGNVVINNSAGAGAFTLMRNANGSENTIEFDSGSLLTLNSNLGTTTPNSNVSGFIFNGTIAGNQNFRVSDNTSVIFGSTSSNPDWGGQLVFIANASAIVNAADNNSFYKGTTAATRLQVNGNNSSIELNGANIFEAGITVAASHTFTFKVNKNQSGVRNIVFSNNGTIDLEVDEDVTNLSFIDNSGANWNSGTLNITGFKEGIIRFGEDVNGLTAGQISQITADNGGKVLMLDANGYLVNVPDFTFASGVWSPSNPIGASTSTDNIFIENGSTDITGILLANSLRIASDATLNVASTGILDLRGDLINNGSLVFKSDADGSGQLDEFTGSMLGEGEVTTERFIPAEEEDNLKRAFRFISPSVNSTENIRVNWQENASAWNNNPSLGFGTHITGVEPNPNVNANSDQSQDGNNGFDWQPSGNASLFLFNTIDQEWNSISNTDINKLIAGKAYRLMVRGDRSIDLTNNESDPKNTTLRATGKLVYDQVDMSMDLSQVADGFSFVGNPYQAVIDFSSINPTNRENLRDFIYVWDATLGGANGRGAYVVVQISTNAIVEPPSPSSSSASKFIAPNQAFFVRNTSAGNPTLVFNEANKATDQDQVEVFSTYSDFYINSRLYKTEDFLAGNTEVDAVGVQFNSNYTTVADEEDVEKIANPNENFAIINNGLRAIDKQNLPTVGHEIELFINAYTSNEYSLTFDMDNTPDGLGVFLNDAYIGTQTELTPQSVYDFTVDANIPASMAYNRFQISFGATTLGVEENAFNSFNVYPNPTKDGRFSIQTNGLNDVNVNLSIFNMIGQQVLSETHTLGNSSQINVNASRLSTGVYVVQLSQGSNSFVSKLIIE